MANLSSMLFTYDNLVNLYEAEVDKILSGILIKAPQARLCLAAACATDFVDFGENHPDYQKMKSFSAETADIIQSACSNYYMKNTPKTSKEITDFIRLMTKEIGSYELFVLCNYMNTYGKPVTQASVAYEDPDFFLHMENLDYSDLDGLHLSVELSKDTVLSFDTYKAINQSLKQDCCFEEEHFSFNIDSFHRAFKKEILEKI